MLILDSQKAELLKKVVAKGFKERDFDFVDHGTEKSVTLKYKHRDFYLKFFIKDSTSFTNIRYRPAKDRVEHITTGGKSDWNAILTLGQAWGEFLKREVDARAMLDKNKAEDSLVELIHTSHRIENKPISDEDVKRIQESVDELAQRIIEDNPDLSASQTDTVNEIRDILKEEAEKQGYRTWIQIFASNLIILIAEICTDPQKQEQLLDLAKAVFSWMSTPLL